MPAKVVFIDTSVLLNVLKVPGSGNDAVIESDVRQFVELANDPATQLVLPLAAIIETGNAIASVPGGDRYRCTTAFVAMLEKSLQSEAPWVTAGFADRTELLSRLLGGGTDIPRLEVLMMDGVGTGDASILAEVAEYRKRIPSMTPVEIWTHDDKLNAYA